MYNILRGWLKLRRSGVVTKIRLFYAIVMTYDFKHTRILRRRGMKINDNIVFDKKDVIKFRSFIVLSVLLCVFLNSSLIYGFLNYEKEEEKSQDAYFYIDKTESYEFCVNDEMSVEESFKYKENEYKQSNDFEDLKISKVLEEMILNEKEENVIAVTYVQKDESDKEQLKQIEDELDNMKKWVEKNFDEEIKFVVTQGSYEDMEYADSKSLPVGKYIIYKNSVYVDKSLDEEDLIKLAISELFDFGNENKYIFEEDIKHIEDTSEDEEVSESPTEEVSETPTESPDSTIEPTEDSSESDDNTSNTSNPSNTSKEDDESDESEEEDTETKLSTPTATPEPEEETPTPTIVNLALDSDVTASGYINGYEPLNVIDSSSSSLWAVSPTGNDWLRLDLGEEKTITSIEISWSETNYAEDLVLFKYEDDEYKKVSDYDCSGGFQKLSFSEFDSRYIHLSLAEDVDKYFVIYDIKVYGY
jgi:hypothetical protein